MFEFFSSGYALCAVVAVVWLLVFEFSWLKLRGDGVASILMSFSLATFSGTAVVYAFMFGLLATR